MPRSSISEGERFKGPSKWVQYLFARALISVLQRLPIRFAYRFGRAIGCLFWYFFKGRQKTIAENLGAVNAWMAAQGDLPAPDLAMDLQIKEVFKRTGANLFSGFTFSRMSEARVRQHLEVEGLDLLKAALAQGKGAIILLAHMGPWEALAQLPGLGKSQGIEVPFGAMYRPLNNTYLDDWYRSQREAQGTRLLSRRDGFHKPVEFIRRGGMLGVLADQKLGRGERVPFFGRTAKSNPLPGILQRRSSAPMLVIALQTVGRCKWRLSIQAVPFPEETSLRNRESDTLLCNQALEKALSMSPLDGFWFHQRYSKSLQ